VADYPEVAFVEAIARAQKALARIPPGASEELVPLALRCYDELNRVITALTQLSQNPTSNTKQQSQRHRKYQRAIRDLDFIESVGLTALERANQIDWQLNRLVRQIRREIAYPLILPPAVTSISRQYFYIHTRFNFNLLCVPPGEGYSLLHLPDIYHELAHPLLTNSNLPTTRPLRQALTDIRDLVLEHFVIEMQEEDRQRGPKEIVGYLELWLQCWYQHWATELICDLFAIYTLGPAYAWAHVHLCAKRSSDAFATPIEEMMTHPADEARMQMMLFGLDRLGFRDQIEAIENRWLEVVNLVGKGKQTEYRRCYPREILGKIEDIIYKAISKTGCRIAKPDTIDFVHSTLNSAWEKFWKDSIAYQNWEREALSTLYDYCAGSDALKTDSGRQVSSDQSRLLLQNKEAPSGSVDGERSLFADALTRLLRDIEINESVKAEHQLLGSNDILGLEVVPDEPVHGGLYDHLVFERKFYLSDRLLTAFRTWWDEKRTTLLEREQMCRLFFLHEFLHIRQHVDSNTYRYSIEADESFRFIDYQADAFAVELSLKLADRDAEWVEALPLVLAEHIKCGDVFRLVEDGKLSNAIDGGRLQRQLIWHLQYARARCFNPEAAFEDFEIEKHLIIDLYKFNGVAGMENLCRRESVEPSDFSAPLEVNLVWGGKRLRHSLSLPHYTDNLMDAIFNSNLQSSAEAFRALFAEHPELIGRNVFSIATTS
jgi:hypothetical protein